MKYRIAVMMDTQGSIEEGCDAMMNERIAPLVERVYLELEASPRPVRAIVFIYQVELTPVSVWMPIGLPVFTLDIERKA